MSSTLSQDEITAILQGLQSSSLGLEPAGAVPEEKVKRLDLTASQERLYTGRLPGLEVIFERFARSLRATLAKTLGRPVVVTAASPETFKLGTYLKKLPLPSSLHLFRLPPLPGHALLALSTPLAFGLVELLMGGNTMRAAKINGREFSQIETRLIMKLVASILADLEEAWSAFDPVQCVYARSEVNPLALSLVPSTDAVIILKLEIGVERVSADFDVCIPSFTLQPIRDRLSSTIQRATREADSSAVKRMQEHLSMTQVELAVRLAEGTVRVRDLMTLRPGDILPLTTRADAPAKVLIEGAQKFTGTVGASRGNKSVRLG